MDRIVQSFRLLATLLRLWSQHPRLWGAYLMWLGVIWLLWWPVSWYVVDLVLQKAPDDVTQMSLWGAVKLALGYWVWGWLRTAVDFTSVAVTAAALDHRQMREGLKDSWALYTRTWDENFTGRLTLVLPMFFALVTLWLLWILAYAFLMGPPVNPHGLINGAMMVWMAVLLFNECLMQSFHMVLYQYACEQQTPATFEHFDFGAFYFEPELA